MAQKYEIYSETGWNESTQSPEYERLTTVKNENAAIDFVNDIDNIGKYGNMLIKMKSDGMNKTFNFIFKENNLFSK